MRMVFFFITALCFFMPTAVAQEKVDTAFDATLETLRQSVADLSKENQALNDQNVLARSAIRSLEDELSRLEKESKRLEDKKQQVVRRTESSRRPADLDGLKKKIEQVDGDLAAVRAQKADEEARLKPAEDEIRALQQRADALTSEISAMNTPGNSDAWKKDITEVQALRSRVQEQLDDMSRRLQEAKAAWQDMNTLLTTGPQQIGILKAEQENLQKVLPEAEADLARINAQLAEVQAGLDKFLAQDYSDERVGRLQSEVKDMAERNRKVEAEISMTKKVRDENARRSIQEREEKIRGYRQKKEELSQRNGELRRELDVLRKQMVAMDKKKSDLEAGVFTEP